MTAEFDDRGDYREILKIDFADNEEYKKFVKDLAESVASEIEYNDELERNVAYELTHTYMDELAEAVLGKLVERAITQQGSSNGN